MLIYVARMNEWTDSFGEGLDTEEYQLFMFHVGRRMFSAFNRQTMFVYRTVLLVPAYRPKTRNQSL